VESKRVPGERSGAASHLVLDLLLGGATGAGGDLIVASQHLLLVRVR
jgi:hypothetical protein